MTTPSIQSAQAVTDVVTMGVTLGHWTIVKTTTNDEGSQLWRFADVATPGGLIFSISGGGWNKKNTVHAQVASLRGPDGGLVSQREVSGVAERSLGLPDAYISWEKPTAQIVKDIMRRVINNPICIGVATKIKNRIEELNASQAELSAHITALKAYGFSFRDGDEKKTHSVDAWRKDMSDVRVYDNGRVHFSITIDSADLPAILAIVDKNA